MGETRTPGDEQRAPAGTRERTGDTEWVGKWRKSLPAPRWTGFTREGVSSQQ